MDGRTEDRKILKRRTLLSTRMCGKLWRILGHLSVLLSIPIKILPRWFKILIGFYILVILIAKFSKCSNNDGYESFHTLISFRNVPNFSFFFTFALLEINYHYLSLLIMTWFILVWISKSPVILFFNSLINVEFRMFPYQFLSLFD